MSDLDKLITALFLFADALYYAAPEGSVMERAAGDLRERLESLRTELGADE